jgi:hypothetical protein
MKMQIIFKGGAQVTVDVIEFVIKRNAMGELSSVQWTNPANPEAKLNYLDASEVAAVVTLR